MKVVFVSNYFNHHQKPFCDEMYQRLGSDFSFISTSVMREERKKLGYGQDRPPEYVLLAYEDAQKRREALERINGADMVIAGSAPNDMLLDRIRAGKLLLRYAERPFKKKASLLKRLYYSVKLHKDNLWKKNIYMLCASAYASGDYRSMGLYRGRTYKWGYFPEVKEYDMDALMQQKKRNVLMWCGRFIDWKHPDDAIKLAQKLKAAGYDFCLHFVGTGVMEEEMRQLAEKWDLTDRIKFLGSMPPDQVRKYMEETGIYVFTSDRQEGWGAVLNEAMNSGCAVVASHAIGSVPYLIKDGENGLIYPSGDVDALFEKVKYLMDHPDAQMLVGSKAYRTVTETWNAKTAADRVMRLTESILMGNDTDLFANGPCSRAET